MQFGARRAAQRLLEAGIECVLWVQADLSAPEHSTNLFFGVVVEVLDQLAQKPQMTSEKVTEFIRKH
eukprot:5085217-Prymnesium_polylepis.1